MSDTFLEGVNLFGADLGRRANLFEAKVTGEQLARPGASKAQPCLTARCTSEAGEIGSYWQSAA